MPYDMGREVLTIQLLMFCGPSLFSTFKAIILKKAFVIKKTISTPLMIENPVRRPIVPPMRLSCASTLTFLSRLMLSKVAVSKKIWTTSRVELTSSSPVGKHQKNLQLKG